MRAGLSTIQQTLTPEAATVLNHSIAEAGRRNHGQTTPLHVAATLLSSPSGYLRQACIRSHPNSSHPLQCRALELCFSVALERLPAAQAVGGSDEPPISNALMAALKRAQAHQRRGCPEQQQQPLLAVKVELEQLIISILDDPSVSRVMREASFSSPAVKATIEQSLNSANPSPIPSHMAGIGGFRPTQTQSSSIPILNRNLYMNPRLQSSNSSNLNTGNQRNEEVKRVVDIMMRTRKKNPVLVGESEPEMVMKEVLRRIEKREVLEGVLKNVEVISVEKELDSCKEQIPTKIKELGGVIESRIGDCNGVIVNLGDLKWLVEPVSVVSEMGSAAVAEMGKLLVRFAEGNSNHSNNGRVWLIGTATCETYLRCQVYHQSMENDWDLQVVPVASRSPLPGLFPRLGTNGILSSSVESLNPLKNNFQTAIPRHLSENLDPSRRMTCCPQCSQNYEHEVAKLVADKSSSEVKIETARPTLPLWLQNTRLNNDSKTTDESQNKDQEFVFKQKTRDLQKKWSDMCSRLHPNYHHNFNSDRSSPTPISLTSFCNPNQLLRQPFQPKLQQTRNLGETLQLSPNQVASQRASSPPRSPVRTELVLGPTKVAETTPQRTHEDLVLGPTKVNETTTREAHEERVKDFLGCISSQVPQKKFDQLLNDKFANALDTDSFKKLLKGLMEKGWWQPEAASALATTVSQCKLGHGKRQGNIWLLFTGPDRVGKKKMASVLSEHVCGTRPTIICLGSRRDDEEADLSFRGKTALDRIAEAVRRNPFSVIMLQDIDEADMLIRGNIKRAMERGRLVDSYGREISLGNVIFVITGDWSMNNPKKHENVHSFDERKLATCGGWQLRLTIGDKRSKRRASWVHDEERPTRARKEMGCGLSLDLNLAADVEDDRTDGSRNSSDLTIDNEDEYVVRQMLITSVPHDLINSVDGAIVFKRVDADLVRREIDKTVMKTFVSVFDDTLSIEVEDEVLEKIQNGVWMGRTSLQEWAENVLVPTFHQLKSGLPGSHEITVVRLEPDTDSDEGSNGDWLPSKIRVLVDEV